MNTRTYYAIINTFQGDDLYLGNIISRHKTLAKAEAESAKLQRAIVKANGQGSYLPTTIKESTKKVGEWVERLGWQVVLRSGEEGW